MTLIKSVGNVFDIDNKINKAITLCLCRSSYLERNIKDIGEEKWEHGQQGFLMTMEQVTSGQSIGYCWDMECLRKKHTGL